MKSIELTAVFQFEVDDDVDLDSLLLRIPEIQIKLFSDDKIIRRYVRNYSTTNVIEN